MSIDIFYGGLPHLPWMLLQTCVMLVSRGTRTITINGGIFGRRTSNNPAVLTGVTSFDMHSDTACGVGGGVGSMLQ